MAIIQANRRKTTETRKTLQVIQHFPGWLPANKNNLNVARDCRKGRLQCVPGAWVITVPPCL